MKKILIASTIGFAASVLAASAYAHPRGGDGRGFDRMDANGDGKVTADELEARQAALLEAADADGDGAITKEELKTYRKAKRDARREARNPDANGDGLVDRVEFQAAADKRFDRMDKNGDGVLSEDERRKKRGKRHHGKRGK